MRHQWLTRLFDDLESNPATQLRVHKWAQRFWIANLPICTYLFFYHQDAWLRWGVFLTLLYSLYANWATDNGAASAAKADLNTTPSNAEIITEIHHLEEY